MNLSKHKSYIFENVFSLGVFLNRLPLIEDATCETAWTDGKAIGYNPAFFESLDFGKVCGVIVHEILHVALLHHVRRGNRKMKKWNGACDYAANPKVFNAGFSLPDGCLYNKKYETLNAEEIYRLLPDSDDNHGDNGLGEVRDFIGTPEEIQKEISEIQSLIGQSKTLSKKMGNKSASILGPLFDNLNLGKINWKEYLETFLDESARLRYDWLKPNKRYTDFILPTLSGKTLSNIAFIVDTSGSIKENELQQALSECNEIVRQYDGAQIHVIYSDTEINDYYIFEDEKDVRTIKGRGGTSFKKALSFANEIEDACAIIYFTDGESTEWGASDLPVLWLGTKRFNPPFGDFVSYV